MRQIFATFALAALAAASASAEGKRYLIGFRDGTTPAQQAAALKSLGVDAVEGMPEIASLIAEVPEDRVMFRTLEDQAKALPQVLDVQEDVYRIWIKETPSFQALPLPSVAELRARLPPIARAAEAARPPLPAGVDAAEVPWGIARVNAPAAWSVTRGEGVKVAVIDTGIDCDHPDLKDNCAGGYNAFDSRKAPKDDNEHGTHVSGTIAAALDGKGVVGVAPRARLYAVKVLDKDGGSGLISIVKGLIWAGRNHMDVANMSLGAPIGNLFMHAAIKYAASQGVTVVAAAGNDGHGVNYPGAYADAIAVAALTPDDAIAKFSGRGRKVEFIAPGVGVKSSVPGGGYEFMDGTSMATPHVTGLAALAVARGAHGVEAVRAALRRAAVPVPGLSAEEQGAGVIDAARLVR